MEYYNKPNLYLPISFYFCKKILSIKLHVNWFQNVLGFDFQYPRRRNQFRLYRTQKFIIIRIEFLFIK